MVRQFYSFLSSLLNETNFRASGTLITSAEIVNKKGFLPVLVHFCDHHTSQTLGLNWRDDIQYQWVTKMVPYSRNVGPFLISFDLFD